MSSVSFNTVKKVLDLIFGFLSYPLEYGSPFQSYDFAEYAKQHGIEHGRITPLWPRANGEVEAFMKNLGKVLKKVVIEKKDKWTTIQKFLNAYKETPHSTTRVPPAMLMCIPGLAISSGDIGKAHAMARANGMEATEKQKAEYEKRMRTKESMLTVGDEVLA